MVMAPSRTTSVPVPRKPWDDFVAGLDWRQGEHMTLIGPTGAGKTTVAKALLPKRRWVCVLGTKPRDEVLDDLIDNQGYRRVTEWPPPVDVPRIVLWPDARKVDAIPKQREVFAQALSDMYERGGWCVYIDEVWVISKFLGFARTTELLLGQGRSNRLSIVGCTQRPAWVPLAFYSQPTHLFLWQTNDLRDLKNLANISGRVDRRRLMEAVASLDWHDFVYQNVRTGELVISRYDA